MPTWSNGFLKRSCQPALPADEPLPGSPLSYFPPGFSRQGAGDERLSVSWFAVQAGQPSGDVLCWVPKTGAFPHPPHRTWQPLQGCRRLRPPQQGACNGASNDALGVSGIAYRFFSFQRNSDGWLSRNGFEKVSSAGDSQGSGIAVQNLTCCSLQRSLLWFHTLLAASQSQHSGFGESIK